jgi:CheY-like chemotaxis protein
MLHMTARVLFLDDMSERHKTFRGVTSELDVIIDAAYSASEAIQALKDRPYDQVFLDHDLSEDDIMSVVGQPTRVPTGMTVVDFICVMEEPPREIFIHTCNDPAGWEMHRRLHEAHPGINVRKLPFPHLIHFIEISQEL